MTGPADLPSKGIGKVKETERKGRLRKEGASWDDGKSILIPRVFISCFPPQANTTSLDLEKGRAGHCTEIRP